MQETKDRRIPYLPIATISIIVLAGLLALGVWLFLTGDTFTNTLIITTSPTPDAAPVETSVPTPSSTML